MKAIIFDSSTIINLAMNNLLWILQPLKEKYGGEFYITQSIKREVIDTPFHIKRFKLESIQISNILNKGIIKVYTEQDLSTETKALNEISNKIFFNKDFTFKISPVPQFHKFMGISRITIDTTEFATAIGIDGPNIRHARTPAPIQNGTIRQRIIIHLVLF